MGCFHDGLRGRRGLGDTDNLGGEIMDQVNVRVDDANVRKMLETLADKADRLEPALHECGQIVLSSIERNFAEQGRYSGDPKSWMGGSVKWQKLAESTKLKMIGGKRRGYRLSGIMRAGAARTLSMHKILSRSGQLASSITMSVSGNNLTIGTNKIYAAAHQFGVDKDVQVKSHTRTSSKGRSYTVNAFSRHMLLPARPFLVVQDQDLQEMGAALGKYVLGD